LSASGDIISQSSVSGAGAGRLYVKNTAAAATGNSSGITFSTLLNDVNTWQITATQNSATVTDKTLSFTLGGVANVANLSSTGLAVTGALTASGNVAIGGAGQANRNINLDVTAIGANDSANLSAMAKGTGYATLTLGKQGRSAGWDINYNFPSTDALGFFNIGTGTNIAVLSSTGLAVTGALSSTTDITIGSAGNLILAGNFAKYIRANTGSSADLRLGGWNGVSIEVGSGFTNVASFSSTGLAVTGIISSTSYYSGVFDGTSLGGLYLRETATASGANFIQFLKANSGGIGSIARVTTTDAVVYNTTSDGRLKENLRDFTDSGRLIDSLKPRVFDWKNSDENGKNVVGFIAQEEHAADPIFAHIGAVSVGDEDPETITKQWQRSDSALIPILVAELKALRQRVAALETN
jgi:hypothetical protein